MEEVFCEGIEGRPSLCVKKRSGDFILSHTASGSRPSTYANFFVWCSIMTALIKNDVRIRARVMIIVSAADLSIYPTLFRFLPPPMFVYMRMRDGLLTLTRSCKMVEIVVRSMLIQFDRDIV